MEIRKVFIYYKRNREEQGLINKVANHLFNEDEPKYKTIFTIEPITKAEIHNFGDYLENNNKRGLYQVPLSRGFVFGIVSNLCRAGYTNIKIDNPKNEDNLRVMAINPNALDYVRYFHQLFYISNSYKSADVDNIIIRTLNNTLDTDNAEVRREKVSY